MHLVAARFIPAGPQPVSEPRSVSVGPTRRLGTKLGAPYTILRHRREPKVEILIGQRHFQRRVAWSKSSHNTSAVSNTFRLARKRSSAHDILKRFPATSVLEASHELALRYPRPVEPGSPIQAEPELAVAWYLFDSTVLNPAGLLNRASRICPIDCIVVPLDALTIWPSGDMRYRLAKSPCRCCCSLRAADGSRTWQPRWPRSRIRHQKVYDTIGLRRLKRPPSDTCRIDEPRSPDDRNRFDRNIRFPRPDLQLVQRQSVCLVSDI